MSDPLDKEKFVKMLLEKAQGKDLQPKAHEPANIDKEEIEKLTEQLKKELASKKK